MLAHRLFTISMMRYRRRSTGRVAKKKNRGEHRKAVAQRMPSRAALRRARLRFGLVGLVQIHHIVPQEFRHALSRLGVDRDDPQNLMFMPTLAGTQRLQLRPGRLVHDGGHAAYNAWVGSQLMQCSDRSDVAGLMCALRADLRATDADIPWT